jgi:hypothetical protein
VEHPGRPRQRDHRSAEARRRIAATLAAVAALERHQPSGMFYNLALDQGMVMAALGNELTGGRLQGYLGRGVVERSVRPLLAMEEFSAGR